MDSLAYKPGLPETLSRLRSLYERQAADRVFAVMGVPSQTLAEFRERHGDGFCEYPDPAERIDFWDRLLKERTAVEDDSVPLVYLSEMDQGLYGGLLGGDVQFMTHTENGWISSMVAPLLDDWAGFDSLSFDRSHPWFGRYLKQLDTFVKAAAGKFGVSHFILIDGLNFAFELVGATETYLSLDERPEMVRRAIELAFDLNVAVQEAFFDRAGPLEGGTVSNMVEWMPGGRIVSESVDPFHMTSVDYFEAWGREPIERIIDHFDGGVVHIHGNGRHLLEAVSTVKDLRAMFLGDDRGFPQAFDVLAELQSRTGDLPLVVQTDFNGFTQKMNAGTLPGGVLYKVSGVPDVDTANRSMEKVRQYRA
jgi:hypothetical protein